ncbi:MAG: thioredoxin family protein [candidate division WOR-3 bacterium]|nr:thioredoxin family protein [candidate division WOR-3 bacterium]MCX7757658.1 thioredoxin family protein [candidate division WOR-3 bacterium]MDW7987462.1 thioredoxin family protein [candidate division WOR-3 bacterium]
MGIIITSEIEQKLKENFIKNLKEPVKLIVFTQELECQYCRENRILAEELSKLSPLINLEVYNFLTDKEKVSEYQVEMVPATVIVGKKDYGIKFYGIPAGYEFTSLIETITMISNDNSQLQEKTKLELQKITRPINIKVFVTPTCPYCPGAVILANRFALESFAVTSAMIEATEFPHLSNKYQVYAVPKTVINETVTFVGQLSEEEFLEKLLSLK